MKVGDIIEFNMETIGRLWRAKTGLITKIHMVPSGCGQIHLMANGTHCTVPWTSRHKHITKVLSTGKQN